MTEPAAIHRTSPNNPATGRPFLIRDERRGSCGAPTSATSARAPCWRLGSDHAGAHDADDRHVVPREREGLRSRRRARPRDRAPSATFRWPSCSAARCCWPSSSSVAPGAARRRATSLAAILIVVFGFFFVTVSSRITGLIGTSSNPISGMTIATLILTCMIFVGARLDRRRLRADRARASARSSASPRRTPARPRRISRPATSSAPRPSISRSASIIGVRDASAFVIGVTTLYMHQVFDDRVRGRCRRRRRR